MNYFKLLATCAILFALYATKPVAAESASPYLADLVKQAAKEETLRLSWGDTTLGGPTFAQHVVENINKAYGLNLTLQFTPIQAMARVGSQLLVEMQAGQPAFTDVYLATPAQIVPLLAKDMFIPVEWEKLGAGRITRNMIDANGASIRIATGVTGALVNTATSMQPPKDLFDFLKPEWKGRIATTVFGAGFDGLSANDVWGESKTLDYVTKLAPQIAGFIGCTDTERVATGEFAAFVMDCVGDKVVLFEEKGAPIRMVLQPDATARRYFSMQIPKHARSKAAAKLFILYLHSKTGQAELWDATRLDLVDYPESRMARRLKGYEASGVRFFDVTIPWWQQHPEITSAVNKIRKILASARRR